MEYVAKGKLQEFLRKSRAEQYYGNLHGPSQKLTSRDLTSFCYQVNLCFIITLDLLTIFFIRSPEAWNICLQGR